MSDVTLHRNRRSVHDRGHDDEESLRRPMRRTLVPEGHGLTLVLTDIQLPRIDCWPRPSLS